MLSVFVLTKARESYVMFLLNNALHYNAGSHTLSASFKTLGRRKSSLAEPVLNQ